MSIDVSPERGEKSLTMLIPFSGFYESIWDDAIEREVQAASADLLDQLKQEDERFGDESAGDVLEVLYDHLKIKQAATAIAKEYAEQFGYWLDGELGLEEPETHLEFLLLDMPCEYNFRTDLVFVEVHPKVCREMLKQVDRNVLSDTIRDFHQSRSGFISRYSLDASDWEERDDSAWDYNELYTLLCAWMRSEVHNAYEVELEILERMEANGVIHNIVNDALDWKRIKENLFQKMPA